MFAVARILEAASPLDIVPGAAAWAIRRALAHGSATTSLLLVYASELPGRYFPSGYLRVFLAEIQVEDPLRVLYLGQHLDDLNQLIDSHHDVVAIRQGDDSLGVAGLPLDMIDSVSI